jgi:hypothetical protein
MKRKHIYSNVLIIFITTRPFLGQPEMWKKSSFSSAISGHTILKTRPKNNRESEYGPFSKFTHQNPFSKKLIIETDDTHPFLITRFTFQN